MQVEGNDSKMVNVNYKNVEICGIQIFGIWKTERMYVVAKGFPYAKSRTEMLWQ
jgi:hypothetical protein